MKNYQPLVSIIIPTYNNAPVLPSCLRALKGQIYKDIEIVAVDGFSKDESVNIAKRFGARVFLYGPDQRKRKVFGAPYQRNFGAKMAKGEYIYYVDADMIPGKDVVKECIEKARKGFDAVIIREDSFGQGFWAGCKKLERRAYWGDDNVEAPRFIKKSVWDKLGGLNDRLGADDWDMYDRLKKEGYKTARIQAIVLHNEGKLSLTKLIRKRYLYGRSIKNYVLEQKATSTRHFFPIRTGFIKNWRLFLNSPIYTVGVVVMRSCEYLAGFAGLVSGIIFPPKVELATKQR